VAVVTSSNQLEAACPHSVPYVEAPDPDIIMGRLATSERTTTPAVIVKPLKKWLDNIMQLKG
jgi:hypothetical protein